MAFLLLEAPTPFHEYHFSTSSSLVMAKQGWQLVWPCNTLWPLLDDGSLHWLPLKSDAEWHLGGVACATFRLPCVTTCHHQAAPSSSSSSSNSTLIHHHHHHLPHHQAAPSSSSSTSFGINAIQSHRSCLTRTFFHYIMGCWTIFLWSYQKCIQWRLVPLKWFVPV